MSCLSRTCAPSSTVTGTKVGDEVEANQPVVQSPDSEMIQGCVELWRAASRVQPGQRVLLAAIDACVQEMFDLVAKILHGEW